MRATTSDRWKVGGCEPRRDNHSLTRDNHSYRMQKASKAVLSRLPDSRPRMMQCVCLCVRVCVCVCVSTDVLYLLPIPHLCTHIFASLRVSLRASSCVCVCVCVCVCLFQPQVVTHRQATRQPSLRRVLRLVCQPGPSRSDVVRTSCCRTLGRIQVRAVCMCACVCVVRFESPLSWSSAPCVLRADVRRTSVWVSLGEGQGKGTRSMILCLYAFIARRCRLNGWVPLDPAQERPDSWYAWPIRFRAEGSGQAATGHKRRGRWVTRTVRCVCVCVCVCVCTPPVLRYPPPCALMSSS